MKSFILLFAILLPISLFSQTTISPDTVCYQSIVSNYSVTNDPNNTYDWTVLSPGTLISGQGTNSIVVDWSAASPGLITNAISVFPTNQYGCVGPVVNIDVFILEVIPTVLPITVCYEEPCIPLSGSPIGGTWSGIGVSGNTFCSSLSGVGTFTITYTYTIGECTFTATGDMTVNPLPTIDAISHD